MAAWEQANKGNARKRAQAEGLEVEPDELLTPIGLHECRHTFASLMIAAGVNAKAICDAMGHASVTMTFDRYGHLMPDGRDQARERMHAYLGRSKLRAAGDADLRPRCALVGPDSS